MNLKIIINSLLLIVVLHLFLQNIDYSVNIGLYNTKENFDNNIVDDSRSNLLKYLNEDDGPNASNSNLEKNSIPNFGDESRDISKFFKVYDNLDEKGLENSKNDFESSQDYLEKSNTLEQQWKYNNEMPMNGGLMSDSVVGFDSLDGNYASINFNEDDVNKDEITDLRNGMNPPMNM